VAQLDDGHDVQVDAPVAGAGEPKASIAGCAVAQSEVCAADEAADGSNRLETVQDPRMVAAR
jgi:hypothetical protein